MTYTQDDFPPELEDWAPSDRAVRLFLQCLEDTNGVSGTPCVLSAARDVAKERGFITESSPPGGGWVEAQFTPAGREWLAQENARLGPLATRMAHSTRTLQGVGEVVFGYPFEVPLSRPVRWIDGTPCVDDKAGFSPEPPVSPFKWLTDLVFGQ